MKKIGVAVKENGKRTEHFGICEYFVIYDYNEKDHSVKYKKMSFSSKDPKSNNEEWESSADAIKDCDIVFCEKIGMVAKSEVEKMGIKVIESEGLVENVLDNFISSEIKKDNIVL